MIIDPSRLYPVDKICQRCGNEWRGLSFLPSEQPVRVRVCNRCMDRRRGQQPEPTSDYDTPYPGRSPRGGME